MKGRKKKVFSVSRIIVYLFLIGLAAYTLVPLVTIGLTASRSNPDVFRGPFTLPSEFVLFKNLREAWTIGRFGVYMKNSIIITVPTVLIVLFLATFAGYSFAKLRFRARDFLFYLILAGLMLPFQATMIPLYFLLNKFRLINTHWSVIITIASGSLPFGIFMMRSFFMSLPTELIEAARINGCSEIQTLWNVMLPLTFPAWISLIIFQSMWTWNNFIVPFLFINDTSLRPITLGLMFYQSEYQTNYSLIAAGVLISILPLIVIFTILQRRFTEGIIMGALKG
ncbi:MAG: carbohydrate ABC transporter permease [Candidatus Caldatribacteriaceae bacterium]